MARRLDQLKLLNMDRWKAHIQERSTREEGAVLVSADPLGDAHHAHPAPTPTAGELFNRPNSMHNGEFVPRYHRKEDAQESKLSGKQGWADPERMRRTTTPRNGGANWMTTREAVPTSGDDFTSVPLFSPFKYRVPVDSVTRKQGDCRLFLCCGWRWTAVSCATLKPPFVLHDKPYAYSHHHPQAQWIWALNLVCFIAHTSMIVLTYWLAYWRHDLDPMNDTKHVMIPIYRIRSIPTQGMLDKNLSRWAEGWNLTSTEPNSGLFLYDNGMPASHAPTAIYCTNIH